jgi:hypothetical protein
MATFNKFNQFVADLAQGVHNFGTNTLKVMLSNTAPNATNTIKSNITEIAAGNGYTAGGNAITITTNAQTAGTYTLAGNNVTFTASGGAIATFEFAVIYNSTPANGNLIGWYDYGSTVSLASGSSFTIQFNASGILTIT